MTWQRTEYRVKRGTLPMKITTKGEALDVATMIFPPFKFQLQERLALNDGKEHIAGWLIQQEADSTWWILLEWFLDRNTRVYKRARGHFVDHLTKAYANLCKEVIEHREREYQKFAYQRELERKQAAAKLACIDGDSI